MYAGPVLSACARNCLRELLIFRNFGSRALVQFPYEIFVTRKFCEAHFGVASIGLCDRSLRGIKLCTAQGQFFVRLCLGH
jgi:hypothetical protein